MEFIIVENCRLGKDHPYMETINIEHIISFHEGRIDLDNGSFILIKDGVLKDLKNYLRNKGHSVTMLGE